MRRCMLAFIFQVKTSRGECLVTGHSFGGFSAIIMMIMKKKHVSNSVELSGKDGVADVLVASL